MAYHQGVIRRADNAQWHAFETGDDVSEVLQRKHAAAFRRGANAMIYVGGLSREVVLPATLSTGEAVVWVDSTILETWRLSVCEVGSPVPGEGLAWDLFCEATI